VLPDQISWHSTFSHAYDSPRRTYPRQTNYPVKVSSPLLIFPNTLYSKFISALAKYEDALHCFLKSWGQPGNSTDHACGLRHRDSCTPLLEAYGSSLPIRSPFEETFTGPIVLSHSLFPYSFPYSESIVLPTTPLCGINAVSAGYLSGTIHHFPLERHICAPLL
jgi:hypothetical protein